MIEQHQQDGSSESARTEGRPRVPSVLIVDDHRSFAELLAAALEAGGSMTCLGVATSAAQGVAMAAAIQPDIIVMDIAMPGQDGIAATRKIRASCPDSVVAVVTSHTDPSWIAKAAQAGASAFVGKSGSLEEMVSVLRSARPGHMLVAPSMYTAATRPSALRQRPSLSQRELEVVTMLAAAVPVREIASCLQITEHTCRGYVKSIRHKLGVSSQLEAVVKAQQLRLIDPLETA